MLASKGISFLDSNQMSVGERTRLLSIIEEMDREQQKGWNLPEEVAKDPRILGSARIR